MHRRFTILTLAALMGLSCALPQRRVKVLKLEDAASSVVTYPADLRGAYMPDRDARFRLCAEPAPDVALESVEKLTANLKGVTQTGQTVEGSVATDLAAKVVALAGRTQLVLLAREMLYRACELSVNYPDTSQQTALDMYNKAAQLVEALGRADEAHAKADLARQATALKNAGATIDELLKK